MDRPYHLQIVVVGPDLYLRTGKADVWYLGAEPDGTNASARAHKLARLLDCQVNTAREHPIWRKNPLGIISRP